IRAVDRQNGTLAWESASDWGLDRMVGELRYLPYLSAWVHGYLVNNARLLYENSVQGLLSTDGSRVYAVEDLPFPPYPISSAGWAGPGPPVPDPAFGPDLTEPASPNRLLALDGESGKLVWEVGGRAGGGELNDSYFLGPPFHLEGRLYTVIEKNQG